MNYLPLLLLVSCASPYTIVQQRSPALEYLLDDIATYRNDNTGHQLDKTPSYRYYDMEIEDYNGIFIYINNGGY